MTSKTNMTCLTNVKIVILMRSVTFMSNICVTVVTNKISLTVVTSVTFFTIMKTVTFVTFIKSVAGVTSVTFF